MVLSFKTGTWTSRTNVGTDVITGVGFQPKALIVWTAGYFVAFNTIDSYFEWGFGAAADTTAANQKSIFTSTVDASATSNTKQAWNGSAAMIPGTGDSQDSTATISALGADGFTVNWTLASGTGNRMEYLAFGGADITNTKVGEIIGPTTTGSVAYTGIGFQADILIFFGSGNTSVATVNGSNRGLGFAKSTSAQVCNSSLSKNGQANMVSKRYQRSGNTACYALIDDTTPTNVGLEGSLTTIGSDGFTINWTTVATSQQSVKIGYLAIKGGQWKVGSIASPTAGTAPVSQATTGVGFRPTGLLLSTVGAATGTTVGANCQAGFGAGQSATNRCCAYAADNDAATDAVTMNVNKNAKIITMYTATAAHGSSTLNAEADLTTLDVDGFTLSWTTKSGTTAYECIYLACGDTLIVTGARNFQIAKAYFTSDN